MTPLNITILQGATFQRTVAYKDSEGDGIDLTDAEIRGQLRPTFTSTVAIEFDFTVTDAANGVFTWELDAEASAAIPILAKGTQWVYDVEIEFSGGVVKRILQGSVLVSPEVTK